MKKFVTTWMVFMLASCFFVLEANKPPRPKENPKSEIEEDGGITQSSNPPPVPIIWW